MTQSRRTFLQQTSVAMGATGLLFHRSGHGLWAATPNDVIPEPDEKFMRDAALAAMEAAKAAGASFADIRINASRCVEVSRETGPFKMWPFVGVHLAYGVRAIVDGSWGFAYDSKLSIDAVTAAARTAVRLARINRPRRPRSFRMDSGKRRSRSILTPSRCTSSARSWTTRWRRSRRCRSSIAPPSA